MKLPLLDDMQVSKLCRGAVVFRWSQNGELWASVLGEFPECTNVHAIDRACRHMAHDVFGEDGAVYRDSLPMKQYLAWVIRMSRRIDALLSEEEKEEQLRNFVKHNSVCV